MRRSVIRTLGVVAVISLMAGIAGAEQKARFVGRIVMEWVAPPQPRPRMKLLEEFVFEDSRGYEWIIPRGTIIDDSSYAEAYRNLVGEPYAGRWRRAELMQQAHNDMMSAPWRAVRSMFYEAMLVAGASESEAKMMYMVSYATSPRWQMPGTACFVSCHDNRKPLQWRTRFSEAELRGLVDWIEIEAPPIDAIAQKVDSISDGLPHPASGPLPPKNP